jgi:hypothetical protein
MMQDVLPDFLPNLIEACLDQMVSVLIERDELGRGPQSIRNSQSHHRSHTARLLDRLELEVSVDVVDLLAVLKQVVQLLGVLNEVLVV